MKNEKIEFERRTYHDKGIENNGVFNSLESATENADHSQQVIFDDIEYNDIKDYTEVIEYRDGEYYRDFYFVAGNVSLKYNY